MNFHIITLFPDAFTSYLGESILKRAIEDEKIHVFFYDPKDYESDSKKRLDDKPYGGGPGMVIRALPVVQAIEKAFEKNIQQALGEKKNRSVAVVVGGFHADAMIETLKKKNISVVVIAPAAGDIPAGPRPT